MIDRLAVSGYRSLRDVTVPLQRLTVIAGGNGSGKSSLYRSLRLLADIAHGRLGASLAAEGGIGSVLWAGPERFSAAMRAERQRVEGLVRSGPVALRLGFSGETLGYAVDLGLAGPHSSFPLDPEIKVEAMWGGGLLGRSNQFAERRGMLARLRRMSTGEWREAYQGLMPGDSMMTHAAEPEDGLELLLARDQMRDWRFYDALRTDRDSPARRAQSVTYTPVLPSDGSGLAAAILTIERIGDDAALAHAVRDAFDGASLRASDCGDIEMQQPGLLRPLGLAELSDGTLRYLMLCAALLSPRPPELMVLNEPEGSLHPALIEPLARLLVSAAERCQIIVVTHAERLAALLEGSRDSLCLTLTKQLGETRIELASKPEWRWPSR